MQDSAYTLAKERATAELYDLAAPLLAHMRLMQEPILWRGDVPALEESARQLREEFSESVRYDFVKNLAWTQADKLRETFLLTDKKITELQCDGILNNPALPETLRRCNVDHVRPLSRQGSNDFTNLCLVPAWVNAARNEFEKQQRKIDPRRKTLDVIVPHNGADGGHDPLPVLPAGFYQTSERLNLAGERFSELADMRSKHRTQVASLPPYMSGVHYSLGMRG